MCIFSVKQNQRLIQAHGNSITETFLKKFDLFLLGKLMFETERGRF